jgi:hypothetical protein
MLAHHCSTSYTIANVFRSFYDFKGPREGVSFDVAPATKKSVLGAHSRCLHHPWNDTPPASSVSVTIVGLSKTIFYIIIFSLQTPNVGSDASVTGGGSVHAPSPVLTHTVSEPILCTSVNAYMYCTLYNVHCTLYMYIVQCTIHACKCDPYQ